MDDRTDRVRRHTAAEVLRRIDDVTVASLSRCAQSPAVIDARLVELDREWDTDRTVEMEAATLGLAGLALGAFVRKPLLALPALVAAAMLLQATTGLPHHAAAAKAGRAHGPGGRSRTLRLEGAARRLRGHGHLAGRRCGARW